MREYRERNREKCRAYYRRYDRANADRKRLARLADRRANPEKYREQKRRYYADPAKVAMRRASQSASRPRHAKRAFEWRESKRDHLRLSTKKWREANPEKAKIGRVNQWAKRNRAPGKITVDEIRTIYEAQDGLCFYCSVPLHGKYQVDHKVPLTRGGTNWADNVCCACAPCNRHKYTRTAEEFLEARRLGVA